jgi:hypothetical protein
MALLASCKTTKRKKVEPAANLEEISITPTHVAKLTEHDFSH